MLWTDFSFLSGTRLAAAFVLGFASPGHAEELTAGVVLDWMSSDQKSAYLAGVIEGLAYARFVADNRSTAGMGCLYQWYYARENQVLEKILVAFARYPDQAPGAIVAVLARQKCGG